MNFLREKYNNFFIYDKTKENLMTLMRQHFKPEFLNRVDEIVFFKALTMNELSSIVEIQINNLQKLLKEKNIALEATEEAKEFLAQRGFNPIYGARPLKRTIRQLVENSLSKKLLSGEIDENDNLIIDVQDDVIIFVKQ